MGFTGNECGLDKTIFNITPCFNDFEKHFAQFLDQAKDVSKFAKLAETYTKFSIEYINKKCAIAYFYPYFIASISCPKKTDFRYF